MVSVVLQITTLNIVSDQVNDLVVPLQSTTSDIVSDKTNNLTIILHFIASLLSYSLNLNVYVYLLLELLTFIVLNMN